MDAFIYGWKASIAFRKDRTFISTLYIYSSIIMYTLLQFKIM